MLDKVRYSCCFLCFFFSFFLAFFRSLSLSLLFPGGSFRDSQSQQTNQPQGTTNRMTMSSYFRTSMSGPGGAPAFSAVTEPNTAPGSQRSSVSTNNRKSAYGRDTMDQVSKDELMHSSDGRDGSGRENGGNAVQNPLFSNNGSNRSDIEMKEGTSAANGGRRDGGADSAGNSGRETDNIRESFKNLPEGRTPLVKAFDRSLSYLTESPSVASPLTSNYYKYGGGQWRDRYVMKSTGWTSANPDAGLPPARLSTAAGGGSNLGHSPPSASGSLL
jgi:hypothetical protein